MLREKGFDCPVYLVGFFFDNMKAPWGVSKGLPFWINSYLSAFCETAAGVSERGGGGEGGGTDGGGGGAGAKFCEPWLTDSVETWGMTRMFS